MKQCLVCQADFEPRKIGRPQVCCSSFCANKRHRELERIKKLNPIVEKKCDQCHKLFLTNIKAQHFCSAKCRFESNRVIVKNRYRERNPLPANWNYDCDDCGKLVERTLEQGPVNKGRYGRFCLTCTKRRKVSRYRKKTVRRQGIVKPGNIHYDEVFARDNGVCWLCDEAVDPALPRVSAGGGTIDHVIPISKGGEDTLENCRLAHWSCNNRKSNKLIEGLNA